ncbi:MAG: sulfatase-like hydrolase/transferase [Bacteroidales bacterium]|nr:sulfatase-like hydrolase/transferase [Bacteroidales bacterium]
MRILTSLSLSPEIHSPEWRNRISRILEKAKLFRDLSLLLILLLPSCSPPATDSVKPNVILILTDDQGSVDLNIYGATDLLTPNLDRLADEGVRFSRFYSGSAICSPSRASILTGMTPHSAGVPGNVSSIPGNAGMPSSRVTIAEMMKTAGYRTAHIGKWHLGYSEETMPQEQGFDFSFGHMGGCIDNYSHFFYWNGPNRHDLHEDGEEVFRDGEFFPDLMYEKAENFILKNRNKPFFLYYALNTPHYPLQPTSEWRRHYRDMEMPRSDYAAFMSTTDENIGKLIKLLNDLDLREQTIIIYLSDHGHSYETRTFGGGGSAGPFRGGKMSLFEGGIRVPAIISWPGRVPEGVIRNQVCHNIDLLPTIAAICKIDSLPAGIEGTDISGAVINNDTLGERTLYWKMGSQWAVMKDKWKLIGLPHDPSGKIPLDKIKDRMFLANMEKDSTESKNLADEYPDILDEMTGEYLEWEHASEDDIPLVTKLQNKAIGARISLARGPDPRYQGDGAGSLLDNIAGSRSFSDGCWLGFEGDDLEAEIDLGGVKKVNSVQIRFLNNPGSWIFGPEYVEISYAVDDKTYGDTVRIEGPFGPIRTLNIQTAGISLEEELRYLKIFAANIKENPEWHTEPGGKAWLFCDEIIIK